MEAFRTHRGKVALLDWADVNTDLIIPARYLKRIERTGYGPLLFADKRYEVGGAPPVDDPERHGAEAADFPLNAESARGATILLVGRNFGCGSSREHAVWAVAQAGYRALIAPGKDVGFADIFEQNAFNNGLLPIELDEPQWLRLAELVRGVAGLEMEIDLERQELAALAGDRELVRYSFEVAPGQRHRLLHGLDAIAETLQFAEAIAGYEQSAPIWVKPRGT
ncbi:MAG: 3-isopropylmalate dehydratase small subunit 2 [Isosphaeraceae bacterium]|jgi:3-isopropylmalate/(R)-2-methylmalate dehydratase small subunit|nr:MAG: 3-isopropylmalate dehydratase small subunit 2 [Isosphaeraceae bacterium]